MDDMGKSYILITSRVKGLIYDELISIQWAQKHILVAINNKKWMANSFGIKPVSFWRSCGAASVGEYNRVI